MTIKLQEINTINQLVSYGEHLFDEARLYFGHGTDNAMDEAAYIVLSITNNLPLLDDQVFVETVDADAKKKILDAFDRRVKEKIPAAYIVGEAWFAGLAFSVNDDVLVPRSPFAELIDSGFSPWVDVDKVGHILDLCTGSGCIGIACAVYFPNTMVDLADISTTALDVARKNIQRHAVGERVEAIESNLFDGLVGKKYDLIVSNPPYVGHSELSALPEEFYKEPRLGLDGGASGLDLVHKILVNALEHLNDGGVLYVEVGNTDEVLQLCYPKVPFLWQDFDYGGHGVFMLTKEQLLEYNSQFQAKLT
jgi:ribosomal protein L3 glutamine methyltransferase